MEFDLQLFKASGGRFRAVPSRGLLPAPSFKRFAVCQCCGIKVETAPEIEERLCDECCLKNFPVLGADDAQHVLEEIVQNAIDNA